MFDESALVPFATEQYNIQFWMHIEGDVNGHLFYIL